MYSLRFSSFVPKLRSIAVVFVIWCSLCTVLRSEEIPEALSKVPKSRLTAEMIAAYKAIPAIVTIQGDKIEEATPGSKDGAKSFNGMGTGVLIDPRGYVVTNQHVIEGIRNLKVTVHENSEKREYSAILIERDLDTDLAVIKINSNKAFPVVKFGRSNDVYLAETVLAIGNPYGYKFTVTKGIVSGLDREVPVNDMLLYRNAIQTDTAINPGNSGGPLLNLDGEMIGINAAIRQGAECIAFAIPVDLVLEASGKLISKMTNRFVYHGIQFSSKSSPGSLLVASVDPGSPAASAGIQAGDVLKSGDEGYFEQKLDFYRSLIDKKANDNWHLTLVRDHDEMSVEVALANPARSGIGNPYANRANPNQANPVRQNSLDMPSEPKDDIVWDTFGIQVVSMPKDEYQKTYAKYKSRFPYGAVVVKSVKPGGLFQKKGVAVGDVLVGVHEWSTTSQDDMKYIAEEWQSLSQLGSVSLWLFRNGAHYHQNIPIE